MFKGLSNDDVPVLYQIQNLNSYGVKYFILENSEYSLFPYEKEVLLMPGCLYKIINISE